MNGVSDKVIVVSNVCKTYGGAKSSEPIPAVKDLSFTVEQSSCVGLLGPNGAGKTTMMKMIYAKCLRDPGGSISVFGHDPATNELAIKFISGVVPQEDNLDEELNVWQNLWVYAKLYGMGRRAAEIRIPELLGFMELGEKRTVKIKELSGGMKRRLIIVRALLHEPRLLILDEPTTGLDPQVRHLIWDKLRQLKRDGLTILLTTHYMEEAFQICDSVLIMHKGAKVMEGPPRDLVEEHIERFVLELRGKDSLSRAGAFLTEGAFRVDDATDSVRVFSNAANLLQTLAGRLGTGEYRIRETNLEDLFLKTTGSTLDE
jgi:lipooligosaccharide transport system ATP-binding protein